MIKVNAIGDTCPIPVIKTKNAIKQMNGEGVVEVMVDNEIAVQNLTKMAKQKQYACRSEKLSGEEYRVVITVTKGAQEDGGQTDALAAVTFPAPSETPDADACIPDGRKKKKI